MSTPPQFSHVPQQTKPNIKLVVIIFAAIALAAALAITLTLLLNPSETKPPVAKTFTVTGTFEVSRCGSSGYPDLQTGTQVTVVARDNTVLGIGQFVSNGSSTYGISCTYTFTVPNVPAGLPLYGVHAGNANRGVIWKNEAGARAGFALSIG
jgi:hypothetical protein